MIHSKRTIFIVVGRLGKNLIVSKTLPVIASGYFTKIYIFSENQGIEIKGAEYVVLPDFIRRLRPRILKKVIRLIYEPLQLIIYSLRLQPAIIHGYYFIPKGFNSLIAAKISRSKVIVSIIGGKEEIETSFFIKKISRFLIIWLLKKADHITTKGINDNKYLFSYGVKEERVSIFNGAIDTKRFCYQGEEKNIDILFAGYFDEFKGPQRAVEIIQGILKELPYIKAVFIGHGPLFKSIVNKIGYLGLSKNITIEGYVNDSEKYFKHSRILIFPSANEGLSTAMLEAMACQCVPITSNVGNQTEAALNNYNSIVISDFMDVQEFSAQAIRLLKDKSYLKALADNAEKTVLSKYSSKAQSHICQQFYLSVNKGTE